MCQNCRIRIYLIMIVSNKRNNSFGFSFSQLALVNYIFLKTPTNQSFSYLRTHVERLTFIYYYHRPWRSRIKQAYTERMIS